MGTIQAPAPLAPNTQSQTTTTIDDETYRTVWQTQHEFTRTRWTISTFFMSVSFAILGFSFDPDIVHPANLALRISGVVIYWFAYALFWHFANYNLWLRHYLEEMERTGHTTITLMTYFRREFGRPHNSRVTKTLLAFFGLLYSGGIYVLWLLGI